MTRGYTQMGSGDMCQADDPEDTRLACEHCLSRFTPSNGFDEHCGYSCWHLDNLGKVKSEILKWLEKSMSDIETISLLKRYGWFSGMTDSTVNRWKRAISTRYEQDAAIIAQATELENYNDGY